RQPLLERIRDVHVVVELVDEVDGEGAAHRRIGDQVPARPRPGAVVEHLAVDPEDQRADEREQRRQHEEGPDCEIPAPGHAWVRVWQADASVNAWPSVPIGSERSLPVAVENADFMPVTAELTVVAAAATPLAPEAESVACLIASSWSCSSCCSES